MTDNEIRKGLKCCMQGHCSECPFKVKYSDCRTVLQMMALDLSVRLQFKEIQQLKKGLAIIKCKDCKHYETGKDYQPYCNNINGIDDAQPDDFCSYAHRKE